ncbi:MAG: hypothetical protein E7266_04295 [Lachnospiraceae bacterium]|nr:hypothetical protein [Lachnospiraceae bacterium]
MKKRIISLLTIAAILGTSIPLNSEDVKAFADSIKGAEETITILEEVEELRGEYEKHFLNSDGTITAVSYEKPVHTFEEGEWQEIDNTLQSEENVLVNKEGILDVAFADTTDDSGESESADSDLVTIEKDDYKISWSITAEDEGMEEPEAERYLTSSMFRIKKEKESGKTEKKKVTYTMKEKS